jgi:uncharacterized protein YjiS (DUF1127 family)
MLFFNSISRFIRKKIEYNHAVQQLSNMTDRELSDVGINRDDIHFVVRQDMARKSLR